MSSFWINQPYILIDKDKIMDIWPLEKMNRTEKLNAISRLIIILTIIGIILTKSLKIIISGVVTLIIIVILYLLFKKDDILNSQKKSLKEEGFSNYNKIKHNFTNPNITNPTMNLLLPEIQDNPNKVEAAESYNKFVTEDINLATKDFIKSQFNDDKIDDKLFNNLGDNYQFEQSMRQFYTTANTKVCNNQSEFARFCYGNMASCKDNNIEQCIKNNPRHINM
tara:strand:- start:4733 stop:5401 length:669 start_codon:yes stop_codon:yes gene_type:complete